MAWYRLPVVANSNKASDVKAPSSPSPSSLLLLLLQSLQLHFLLVRLRPPGRVSLSSAPTLWLCLAIQAISAESSQCFIPPVPSGASHVRRPPTRSTPKQLLCRTNRWLPLKRRRGLLYIHWPKEAFLTFLGIASLRLLLCFCTFSTTIAPVIRHLQKPFLLHSFQHRLHNNPASAYIPSPSGQH